MKTTLRLEEKRPVGSILNCYVFKKMMPKFKGSLIIIPTIGAVSLDLWVGSANFTLGLIALTYIVLIIYACLSIHRYNESTFETKFHYLKAFITISLVLFFTGWGTWHFLSDPLAAGYFDGYPFFKFIPGICCLGTFIFFSYVFLLNIKTCLKV